VSCRTAMMLAEMLIGSITRSSVMIGLSSWDDGTVYSRGKMLNSTGAMLRPGSFEQNDGTCCIVDCRRSSGGFSQPRYVSYFTFSYVVHFGKHSLIRPQRVSQPTKQRRDSVGL
jgi:hypothetical protein